MDSGNKDNHYKPDPAIIAAMVAPLIPKEIAAPKGSDCPECRSTHMRRTVIQAAGPFSGRVTCGDCGFSTTVMAYLASKVISVEPSKTNKAHPLSGSKKWNHKNL